MKVIQRRYKTFDYTTFPDGLRTAWLAYIWTTRTNWVALYTNGTKHLRDFKIAAHMILVYKDDQKSTFMLTYTLSKIFFIQVHKMVRKKSRILRIWCMEGRRGRLQFNTFRRRFVYRWHLTMRGMKTWSKLFKIQDKISEVIFNKLWSRWSCVKD